IVKAINTKICSINTFRFGNGSNHMTPKITSNNPIILRIKILFSVEPIMTESIFTSCGWVKIIFGTIP
ncbi:hypothetical protein OFN18_29660, partial [Escherichia coli]|nr:hypothetical protein [Escherichia coli]